MATVFLIVEENENILVSVFWAVSLSRRKTGGASHHAGPVKVQPPFLYPMIEILVAAKVSSSAEAVASSVSSSLLNSISVLTEL